MHYPIVAVDKAGHGYLVLDDERTIGYQDEMIEFVTPPVLETVKFPVKLFVNHLLAGTCQVMYETAVIKELQKHMESYLMPEYISKKQCQDLLDLETRPVVAERFFQFWAPFVQENIEMATKKPAAKKPVAAKVAKPKTEKATKEPKAKKPGIGAFCMDLIEKGKTNDEILASIAKTFPEAKTSKGCIAFYRNKAKAAG